MVMFEYLYFFNPATSAILSGLFGKIYLPGGYLVIAAFGIVWYGIAVYLAMFLAMAYSLEGAVTEDGNAKEGTGFATAALIFAIVCAYLFNSALPHGWKNLKGAGFEEFKAGVLDQEEAIFTSHPNYLPILATLNLKDQKAVGERIVSSIADAPTKAIVIDNVGDKPELGKLHDVLDQMSATDPNSVA